MGKMASAIPFASIVGHAWRLPFLGKEGKSTRVYYSALFGERAYDRFFSKAFRAVICQPADDYPAGMLLKRRPTRLKEYPRKLSFEGGLSAAFDALARAAGLDVRVNHMAVSARRDEEGYHVTTVTGEIFSAPALALAVPPSMATFLVADHEPTLSWALSTVPSAGVDALGLVVPASATRLPEVAGVISLDDRLYSVVCGPTVVAGGVPSRGFTFHFERGALSEEERLSGALSLLGIERQEVTRVEHATHVLPSPRLMHARMETLVKMVQVSPDLYVTGNYFHGLSLEDCANRAGEEAARFIARFGAREG
jgi:protoporphyrinogen oxidase